MLTAYILLTVDSGREKDTLMKVKKLPEVKKADVVYGAYDIIAFVEVADLKALQELIGTKIRGMKDVSQTSTMITWEPQKR